VKETTAADNTKTPATTTAANTTEAATTTPVPETTAAVNRAKAATTTAANATGNTTEVVTTTAAKATANTTQAAATTPVHGTTIAVNRTEASTTTAANATANTTKAVATTPAPEMTTVAKTTAAATRRAEKARAKPEALYQAVSTGVKCATCPSMALLGCSEVAPGHTCEANTSMSECISDNTFTATCPKDNAHPKNLAHIHGVFPQVLCRVCSLKLAADTDPRKGFYTGFLKFGPNILNGKVTERIISEYRVYWSNAAAKLVGSAVAILSRMRKSNHTESFSCCSDTYEAVLAGERIPAGASGLMVLPVDIHGLVMPVGSFTPVQDRVTPMVTPAPTPAPTTATTTTEVTTTTKVRPVKISGRLTLQTAHLSQFATDPAVKKALGNGIAYAAHVSPDRVAVSLHAALDLVQVLADGAWAEAGMTENYEHRAGETGRVTMSYTITLPAYEASESDHVMQELRRQTPSSLGSLLGNEVGKISNANKYDMKVLALETPTSKTFNSAAAHIWKPFASTLPVIFAMLVRGLQ
jgi:hypothetical protein